MAQNATIGGSGTLFVGEDKTFRFELLDVAGLPVDMGAWVMIFDVRISDKAVDPPIFSKTVVVTGTFNTVRAVNTQRGFVQLSDTELNTVRDKTYRYSWKRMDDGGETVLAWGDFVVEKATAP